MLTHQSKLITGLLFMITAILLACSGGGGADDDGGSPPSSSFILTDPTPGDDDSFGSQVVILGNGNIVITDPGDSSVDDGNNGAVHLYETETHALIGSIYGDSNNDRLGSGGISALGNNFIIISPQDDNGTELNVGSVRLINGITGEQINAVVGNDASDQLGSDGVTLLANDNYVIISPAERNSGLANAGSVRLIDGSTGLQTSALFGDQSNDAIGSDGVTVLDNGNYVVVSSADNNGLISNAGSVRLMNGITGVQISVLEGDAANLALGGSGVKALSNNNYVVASPNDSAGGLISSGSVRLFNGSTGAQINALLGDETGDRFGSEVFTLTNDNYVILSPDDNDGALNNVGSIGLVNGTTGVLINDFMGNASEDSLGLRRTGITLAQKKAGTALSNNNFVVVSTFDDDGLNDDSGSVRLFNGDTGVQINVLYGDQTEDQLGSEGVTALPNGHYVVGSALDDDGVTVDVGSVRLMNGSTGDAIGTVLYGDQAEDHVASDAIVALANNNYVVASPEDDNGVIEDAGSVRLVNGSTGVQISELLGDQMDDRLADNLLRGGSGIVALGNSNYVILSRFDDEGGIINAGTARLMNGVTGTQINNLAGSTFSDLASGSVDPNVTAPDDGSFYLLAAPRWDNNGDSDAGFVHLITP
ncbi:beta strand repeat-containing protein [Reinekea sp.]|jgi:hypothetical protein|uniref:beta strand repeat-containing protein n=1 Tax=Reinekea sp. TaxID=1970455 RepID=UPI003989B192